MGRQGWRGERCVRVVRPVGWGGEGKGKMGGLWVWGLWGWEVLRVGQGVERDWEGLEKEG